MRFSRRLDPLPEYLTARLNRLVAERRAAGRDVIALGVGDPDVPPTAAARAALAALVQREDVARYPTNAGLPMLREAVARFYAVRFGVAIDPDREVMPLLGAKEGLAHLAMAQLDPGDVSLIADPGYPVYAGGPILAGATPVAMPLRPELAFQPDLDAVPARDRDRANLLVLGYPNNPTGAVMADDLFERLVRFSHDHDVPVCHDNAYSEITFDGHVAPSYLATPGARENGIEILSLSKAFSVPGWRIAFAVGNAAIIANLAKLKTNVDSGMFLAMQHVAIELLDSDPAERRALSAMYQGRRDVVCDLLEHAGVTVKRPGGTLYLWLAVPTAETSLGFSERILEECDVVLSPGSAYGAAGEGYVRLSLTESEDRLREAIGRLTAAL